MRKQIKFLVLAPCLMAVLCEDIDDECGLLADPEPFVAMIETVSQTYAANEIFFINGETSSMLSNSCNDNNATELVTDNLLFRDAIYILKFNNTLGDLNAELAQNVDINYTLGEEFSGNYCFNAFEYIPELSQDNLTYNYRLGISINELGDYVIISARNLIFTSEEENNAQIFEPYNTLDDNIKFASCGDIFTRNGTQGHYFFRVNL